MPFVRIHDKQDTKDTLMIIKCNNTSLGKIRVAIRNILNDPHSPTLGNLSIILHKMNDVTIIYDKPMGDKITEMFF